MNIIAIKKIATRHHIILPNETADLPDYMAAELIRHGVARAVTTDATPQKTADGPSTEGDGNG